MTEWTDDNPKEVWCTNCLTQDSYAFDSLGRKVCDECGSMTVFTLLQLADMANAYTREKEERRNVLALKLEDDF